MTVIAYRNGIIAADQQASYGNVKRTVSKLFRLENGEVIGFTGTSSAAMELLAWYRAGAKKEDWPQAMQDTDDWAQMIVAYPGGCRWYDKRPYPQEVQDPFTAWGCGAEFAMGAMAMGADAVKAVQIAIEYCDGCGGSVDWHDFNSYSGETTQRKSKTIRL